MANDCINTQYLAVIDNDSLLGLGEMVVKFDLAQTVSDDFLAVQVINSKPFNAKVINGTFMNADYTASEGTEKNLDANTNYVLRVSNTGAKLHLSEKYTLKVFPPHTSYNHGGIHFNLTDDTAYSYAPQSGNIALRGMKNMTGELNKIKGTFGYADFIGCSDFGGTINGDFTITQGFNMTSSGVSGVFANSFIDKSKASITSVNIQDSKIADDIANFPVCSQIVLITLSNSPYITGDVANFPHMDSLQYLYLDSISNLGGVLANLYAKSLVELKVNNTAITGSLEDFAAAQVASPISRTSGTLVVTCNGIITLGGTAVANGTTKTITFSNGSYSIA